VYIVTQGKNQELFQSSEMKRVTLPLILNLNLLHEGDIYLFICIENPLIIRLSTNYDVNYQLPCTGTCIMSVFFFKLLLFIVLYRGGCPSVMGAS
jgi:hypothetical protein